MTGIIRLEEFLTLDPPHLEEQKLGVGELAGVLDVFKAVAVSESYIQTFTEFTFAERISRYPRRSIVREPPHRARIRVRR